MGKFEGSSWQQEQGNLTLFDPKINQFDGNSGGIVQEESTCKMTVDLFLSLGIQEMLPGIKFDFRAEDSFGAKTWQFARLARETIFQNGANVLGKVRSAV